MPDHHSTRPLTATLGAVLALAFGLTGTSGAVDRLVVEGLFKDQAVLNIDGRQRMLRAGQTSPEGVRLISANSKEAVLEIEGTRKTYALGDHIAARFKAPPPGAAISIWPDRAGMYFVDGSINSFSVRFLVDTGATLVAMNKHQARRIGIDYKLSGQIGSTATASGVAKAYFVRLERVRIGEIELRDINAAVLDGDFPAEVLLGNSFLSKFNLDRAGDEMRLRKR